MNLLFALDQNYIPQLKVLLTSLWINNPGEIFSLYLMYNNLPSQTLDELATWCKKTGYELSPIEVEESLFQSAPVNNRYPVEMYYRLLAAQILPDHVEKILYLDPDILVINPIRPLWETELDTHLFAAAAHTGKTELANNVNRIRLGVEHDYYNSGVLLMNLRQCRKEIVPKEIFDFVESHRKELMFPDQDILNAMYGSRILPLDDVLWNYDARNYNHYMVRSSAKYNSRWVMEHTAILHFCGKAKPWKSGYIYRFGVLYMHYEQLTKRLHFRLSET